jgi:hypothetical protein
MSDNKPRPNKFGKGKKRTRLSDGELALIVRSDLQGLTSGEIADLFFAQTRRSLDARTIRMVLKEQNEVWRSETRRNTDLAYHQELARLDMMENEAWRQYQACGGMRRRKDIEQEVIDPEGGRTSTTRTETVDDPELALKWFKELQKLQQARRKILDLETAINFTQNNVYAVKGYAGWTPDEWPDPPENQSRLGDGVIEGEYE